MAMGFGIVISYQIKRLFWNGDHGILVLDFNFKF